MHTIRKSHACDEKCTAGFQLQTTSLATGASSAQASICKLKVDAWIQAGVGRHWACAAAPLIAFPAAPRGGRAHLSTGPRLPLPSYLARRRALTATNQQVFTLSRADGGPGLITATPVSMATPGRSTCLNLPSVGSATLCANTAVKMGPASATGALQWVLENAGNTDTFYIVSKVGAARAFSLSV